MTLPSFKVLDFILFDFLDENSKICKSELANEWHFVT
jgi:hypothetical protein